MIKVSKLEEIVNQLEPINDVVPNLNAGGCGIFALALADNLYAKGIRCKLAIIGVFGTTDENVYNSKIYEVLERCKKNNSEINAKQLHLNGLTLYHVMVEVETETGKVYLDSEGVYDHPRNSRWSIEIEGLADIETIRPFIEHPVGWNQMYNRNFNAKVYKMVNSAVKKSIKEPVYNESERVYATV
jgi:hypothetical protein